MGSPLERRRNIVASEVELRDAEDGPVLDGYASTYLNLYRVGHFDERIMPSSFKRTMGGRPDVRLLVDHEGQPLARTAHGDNPGTLTLDPDDGRGFRSLAPLDATDPDVQRLLPKMRRGDLDQMSFAFRVPVGGDEWDWSSEIPVRTIREVDMRGGDVSIVSYPANEATTASIRSADRQDASFVLADAMLRELRTGRSFGQFQMGLLEESLETLGAHIVGTVPERDQAGPATLPADLARRHAAASALRKRTTIV